MKTRLLIFFLSIFPLIMGAQSFMINGIVTDISEQDRIPRVNIQIKGSLSGTSSDAEGQFELRVKSFPVTLYFSHLGYNDKEVKLYRSPSEAMVVRLEERVTHLNEFVVRPAPVVNLLEDKPLYIWDYEFADDGILLLGSMKMNGWDKRIFMLREKGDTIVSSQVKRPQKLFRDCIGYHHLLRDQDVMQIDFESGEISLHYPMGVEDFQESMLPLVGKSKETWFVRKYYRSNQVLIYWAVDDLTKDVKEFRRIEDELGLNILADRSRLESSSGYTEADRRFEDMCFYDEIYAPMVIINDSVLIFNFVDGNIETYTTKGELISDKPMSFERDKHWEEELLVDEISGRVFTLWEKQGMTQLWEISLVDATLVQKIDIPDLPFIEKVKVKDNQVYFLFKPNQEPYKQLYSMKI